VPRQLGQHFLKHKGILSRLAQAACPQGEKLVIEIGAGTGSLTELLVERTERLIAIEIDPELAGRLQARWSGRPGIEIITGDVLALDLSQWGPAVIAGNIPYYISSPILERVLSLGPLLQRAVLLVQKEVAQRLVAAPGTRQYGLLSVRAQLASRVEILFRVPPSAFSPPPKVTSAAVRLTPYAVPALPWSEQRRFLAFAARCFGHKRRTLRNNLAAWYPRQVLDALPEAAQRAEQLSLAQLIALYRMLDEGG